MARPRDPQRERWEWQGVPGYVAPYHQERGRHPYAYHYYKSYRKSTGLRWNPEFKSTARKLHVAWIQQVILTEAGLGEQRPRSAPPQNRGPGSLLKAIEQFLRSRSHGIPDSSLVKFNQAVNAHFPADVPLTFEAVHNQLIKSLNDPDRAFAQNTLRKHLSELNRLFRYAVQREWMERNPIELIGVPKSPYKDEVAVWTRDQVMKTCRTFRREYAGPDSEWLALLVEWMSYTAMRPGEVLNMQWNHIENEELRIPKTKTGRMRSLPLVDPQRLRPGSQRREWQHILNRIVTTLRELYEKERHSERTDRRLVGWKEGYVWPWSYMQTVNKTFRTIRATAGLPKTARLYDLRATAEDYWVWELNFDLKTLCEFAGHNPATYSAYYRRRYGKSDRVRMVIDER